MTVRVQDLALSRGSTAILRSVTFEVPQGALAAVLGMSGAGKTTLLRCLAGLELFDAGSIDASGCVAKGPLHGASPLRGKVGLVFQSFELFPHLSVLENCVLAPMRVKAKDRASAEARALELLKRLGLGEKAGAYPDHLSGGQKQRVAIARALAMEPSVLLYDEPTSALDPSLKYEVVEALRGVRATGVTQIVVTHDVELARDAMDLVFVMDRGEIAEHGPPAQVFGEPKAEATKRLLGAGKIGKG
jgi:ABC-type polar amino acid transport system ATPase subunit